jgi:hypothetical protein
MLHRASSSILSRKKGGTGRARRILGRRMVRGKSMVVEIDGCEREEWISGVELSCGFGILGMDLGSEVLER